MLTAWASIGLEMSASISCSSAAQSVAHNSAANCECQKEDSWFSSLSATRMLCWSRTNDYHSFQLIWRQPTFPHRPIYWVTASWLIDHLNHSKSQSISCCSISSFLVKQSTSLPRPWVTKSCRTEAGWYASILKHGGSCPSSITSPRMSVYLFSLCLG